jgi:sn1-specific diacylglycerol lipase
MMAESAEVVSPDGGESSSLTSLPEWILEYQRLDWHGFWEPTPMPSVQSRWDQWFAAPSPFQAFAARSTKMGCGGFSPEALANLVSEEKEFAALVDSTTDAAGWNYASAENRFDVPRSGGRAGQRFGDHLRRRWWGCGLSRPAVQQTHDESRDASVVSDSFISALNATLGNRTFSQIPMDPIAAVRRSQQDTAKYDEFCGRLSAWHDVDVAGELSVASFYMRAAYAYTARAGMIDSVSAGAMAFSVQKALFNTADHVDDFSNTDAFLEMMGLCQADLVHANWKTRGPFQSAFAVVRDHEMQWIVVAIRGTLSFQDVLTDAAAHSVRWRQGCAHEGVVKTAQYVVSSLYDILSKEAEARPHYRLVLCGHSLGGAVAAVAAADLRQQASWASTCIAYGVGTPGVMARCMSEELAEQQSVVTIVNGRDWAPRTSQTNVMELLDNLVDLSSLSSVQRLLTGGEIPEATIPDADVEQLPPGIIIQIHYDDKGGTNLLAAKATDYRHTMTTWADAHAHLPISYIQGILEGLEKMVTDGHDSLHGEAAQPEPETLSSFIAEPIPGNAGELVLDADARDEPQMAVRDVALQDGCTKDADGTEVADGAQGGGDVHLAGLNEECSTEEADSTRESACGVQQSPATVTEETVDLGAGDTSPCAGEFYNISDEPGDQSGPLPDGDDRVPHCSGTRSLSMSLKALYRIAQPQGAQEGIQRCAEDDGARQVLLPHWLCILRALDQKREVPGQGVKGLF